MVKNKDENKRNCHCISNGASSFFYLWPRVSLRMMMYKKDVSLSSALENKQTNKTLNVETDHKKCEQHQMKCTVPVSRPLLYA